MIGKLDVWWYYMYLPTFSHKIYRLIWKHYWYRDCILNLSSDTAQLLTKKLMPTLTAISQKKNQIYSL